MIPRALDAHPSVPPSGDRTPSFLPGAWQGGLSVRLLIFSGPFFVLIMVIICDGVGVHTKALHSVVEKTTVRDDEGGLEDQTHARTAPIIDLFFFTSVQKSRGSIYSQSSFFLVYFGTSRSSRVSGERRLHDTYVRSLLGLPALRFAPPLIFLSYLLSNRSCFFRAQISHFYGRCRGCTGQAFSLQS